MKSKKTKIVFITSLLTLLMLNSLVAAEDIIKTKYASTEIYETLPLSTSSSGSSGSGGSSISTSLIIERTLGESNAPVIIEMYTDFQEPYSAKWYKETYPSIKANYIDAGKVKLIIKNYPFSFHSDAELSAKAALCAAQNSVDYPYENPLYYSTFFGYIDFLYNNQASLDLASLKQYAGIMGIDTEIFENCLQSTYIEKIISSEISEGSKKGIKGVPTFFINGKMISGASPYSTFEKAIDTAFIIQPVITKEQVKCVFENTKSNQKCYTSEFSCSGASSCVSDVSGKTGTKLTWKSSCGNYAYTVIDGSNEYAYFDCSDQTTPNVYGVKLSINPEMQTSKDGTAVYEMLLTDLRDSSSNSKKITYNLAFESNEFMSTQEEPYGNSSTKDIPIINGYFDEEEVKLTPGESYSTYLRAKVDATAFKGERSFTVKVYQNKILMDERQGILNIPTVDQTNPVSVVINPEKQYSKEGYATYEVIIYDNHKDYSVCVPGNGKVCAYPAYTYNLYFNSEQNMNGEFDNNQITISAGGKSVVNLKVYTKDKGTNIFSVTAKGEDSKSSAKGILVYGEETPSEPSSYFNGQGFALSAEKKAGALVDIHFIKDGETLSGKFNLENTNYKIDGSQSGSLINFKIYSADNAQEVAKFVGAISEFETFLLLQGNLISSGSSSIGTWYLTAFSQKDKSFVVVENNEVVSQPTTKNIQVNEIVSLPSVQVSETEEEKQIYVQPVEVKSKKFLGIFPTGQKELIAKVTKNGVVTTITLKPFDIKIVEGYEIRVDSSLEDSKDIDLTIKKISDIDQASR